MASRDRSTARWSFGVLDFIFFRFLARCLAQLDFIRLGHVVFVSYGAITSLLETDLMWHSAQFGYFDLDGENASRKETDIRETK